jgi:DNA-binding PadR family transcriptional regulator
MRGERVRRGGPWAHGGGPDRFGGPWRGGRMRRGEIRTAVLAVLADGPAHGYEIIQTLEERSGGMWRPSPGSVYPLLQLLEDENLVQAAERDGKKVFELTDTGREEAAERVRDAGGPPWEHAGRGLIHGELREATAKLHLAAKQVGMTGTPAQVQRALDIVRQARKDLYQLLAED